MMMIIIINIINEGGEMERVVAGWEQQVTAAAAGSRPT